MSLDAKSMIWPLPISSVAAASKLTVAPGTLKTPDLTLMDWGTGMMEISGAGCEQETATVNAATAGNKDKLRNIVFKMMCSL